MPQARSATAAPRRRPERPQPRRVIYRGAAKRVRWDRVGRVALLVVLGAVAALYVQHTLEYLATRSQANQQTAIVRQLTRQNAALTREQNSLHNPATIERDARALGMVLPGERPYVVMGQPSH